MPINKKTNMFARKRPFVIAEVAQSHDGSLGCAHAFVEAVARTGADAIKFQTHIAAAESTPAEPWRVKFSLQDKTRYDYWKRMEFSEEQWLGLRKHADTLGLKFIGTPFSMAAVSLLKRVGVYAWKVGSGETVNLPMIEALAATNLPIIISTGMSPVSEVDRAVSILRSACSEYAVLQCSTAYPCPPEQVGLNMLAEFKERYSCPVGISDHSGTIYPGIAATALGAKVIEVHVSLSREMFGPDVSSSVTTDELRQLVRGVHFISKSINNPINKDVLAASKMELKRMFGKSIVAAVPLKKGLTLKSSHLTLKKPGTGLGPEMLTSVVGHKLKRKVDTDTQILRKDYE